MGGERPMKRRRFTPYRVAGSLLAMLLALAGLPALLLPAASASASVASPAVSGPVGGGTPAEFMFSTNFNLAQVGYQEQEFFISGTAKGYTSTTPLTTDGAWNNIITTGTAGY